MANLSYTVNKGINRPIEFKGLKAQYIYYLAIGLAILLVSFAILYITGVPVYVCVAIIVLAGSALFWYVFRYSHQYGEHGMMKAMARRQVPEAIICRSLRIFRQLNQSHKKRS